MRRNAFCFLLTCGLLICAGCATTGQEFPAHVRGKQIQPPSGIDAKPEPAPKILPQTHFAAALLFERQGLVNKAIAQYRLAIAADHDYVAAFERLGVLLSHQGRHEESVEVLIQASQIAPDHAVIRNNLGFELGTLQQWAAAEEQLLEAIRLNPDLDRAHINLGLILARNGQYAEAFSSFRKCLPEADAFYNMGLVFKAQHRYQDAARAFDRVLALESSFSAARRQRAELASQLRLSSELEPTVDFSTWEGQQVDQRADAELKPAVTQQDPGTDEPQPRQHAEADQPQSDFNREQAQADQPTMASTAFDDSPSDQMPNLESFLGILTGFSPEGEQSLPGAEIEQIDEWPDEEPSSEPADLESGDGQPQPMSLPATIIPDQQGPFGSPPASTSEFSPAIGVDGPWDPAGDALDRAAWAVKNAHLHSFDWQEEMRVLREGLKAVRTEIECLERESLEKESTSSASVTEPNKAAPDFDWFENSPALQFHFEAGEPLATPIDKTGSASGRKQGAAGQ